MPECNYERLLKLSLHAANDFVGLLPRHGLAVGTMLDQCRKNIGNGQYPNDVGDARGTKPIGISAAIEKFVMMADRIKDLRANAGIPLESLIPAHAMLFAQ